MQAQVRTIGSLIFCALISVAPCARGVTFGQIDDFENGLLGNWVGDLPSVSNITTGGPTGAGDNFLQIAANGMLGPGSRLIAYNTTQWTGNYAAAQITSIAMDARNLGENPIHLRFAFGDGSAIPTWFASTDPIILAVGSAWQPVSFSLSAMTRVSGTTALQAALTNVQAIRILSSVDLPPVGGGGARGDAILATLGVDNITAAGAPQDADFNNDTKVDGADFLIWQRGLGVGTTNAQGDANSDSAVTTADLTVWKSKFGGSAIVAGALVPEPASSVVIAVLATLACSCVRSRTRPLRERSA
jgi:hypothetical protein